jgi:hypothetical protein
MASDPQSLAEFAARLGVCTEAELLGLSPDEFVDLLTNGGVPLSIMCRLRLRNLHGRPIQTVPATAPYGGGPSAVTDTPSPAPSLSQPRAVPPREAGMPQVNGFWHFFVIRILERKRKKWRRFHAGCVPGVPMYAPVGVKIVAAARN